ncbi:MAG: type I-C CRISPR-associated protein Cas5c [Dehalococcoidia bacterium]
MPLSGPVRVKFWGSLACFTRPELKVERVSYPVMTPSAARGALEAICWKPEFRWIVEQIEVLRPVQFIAARRNEVQVKAPSGNVESWMRAGKDPLQFPPLYADSRGPGGIATQRNTLALKDVAYLVTARALVGDAMVAAGNQPIKYEEMLRRRVERGQCWQRPYLGCREFAAEFAPPEGDERPVDATAELGLMLYDIAFAKSGNVPVFFAARLEKGVLNTEPSQVLPDEETRVRLGLC